MEKVLKIAFIEVFSRPKKPKQKPPRPPGEFYMHYIVWIGLQPS